MIYFSLTGTIAQLANHVSEGAVRAGAEVRLRQVPDDDVPTVPANGAGSVPPATLADLEWADGYVFGTPTRFGNVAAQFKHFLDSTGPLARAGRLADKAVTGFTSASSPNGGQEATLLALYHSMFHWGAIIVPTGYTDPVLRQVGGNPYGLSVTSRRGEGLAEQEIAAARFVGQRIVGITARLTGTDALAAPAARSAP